MHGRRRVIADRGTGCRPGPTATSPTSPIPASSTRRSRRDGWRPPRRCLGTGRRISRGRSAGPSWDAARAYPRMSSPPPIPARNSTGSTSTPRISRARAGWRRRRVCATRISMKCPSARSPRRRTGASRNSTSSSPMAYGAGYPRPCATSSWPRSAGILRPAGCSMSATTIWSDGTRCCRCSV